jgi:hypothetical protein
MRKWLLLVLVIVGVTAGVGVGYATATIEVAFSMPFLGAHHSNKESFDRVVEDYARLGGYESVAANCSGTSKAQLALGMEAEVIRDLQEHKTSDANLLNTAEAKLLVRATILAEKDARANHQTADTVQHVEDLLKNAGWMNPSEAHMRDVVQELDQDQCKQVVLGAER